MAANWAYVGCTGILTASGPTGSVYYRGGASSLITGSYNLMFYTASVSPYHPDTLVLNGTLNVKGTVSASHLHIKNITEIDATGSTKFGNTNDDLHQRTGSFGISTLSTIVFHATASSDGATPYVGVGTESPISTLEIEGGLTTVGAVLTLGTKEPTVEANDILGRINFYAPLDTGTDSDEIGASISAVAQATFSDSVNSTALHFQTGKSEDATGNNAAMVIDEDGRVGIGDTSPDALLDLQGASGTAAPTLLVDHLDADVIAIDINTANDTADAIDITADAVTTANVIDITADALTSGTALNITSTSTSTTAGSVVKIAATGNRADDSNAVVGLDIDFDSTAGTAARAFRIDSEQTTGIVAEIDGNALTTGAALDVSTSALTTGKAVYIGDNSANTGTRNSVEIVQAHASATGATALTVQSDGGNTGMFLDKNASGVAAQNATGLYIDFDRTVAASGTNAHNDIGIHLDVTSRSLGTSTVVGHDVTVTGYTDGTSTATGMELTTTGADTNNGLIIDCADGGTDFKTVSSADPADFFSISTTTNGATTITTVDASAALAHLTMAIDGDITMTPSSGLVALNDGSNNVFDFNVADPTFRIFDDDQPANYCSIAVGANGETTLTTVDYDAAVAHLNFVVDGDIILGPGGGDVLPDADGTRNLGSLSKRWANIYTADLHLANERGDWTVIEEENYLTIRNNKSGKRFKLLMEEIE